MQGLRKIAVCALAAGALMGVAGCGDSDEPTIPSDQARLLLEQIAEIQANVDNGSCTVAGDRAEEFIQDVQALGTEGQVDEDVLRALENGGEQLQILLADPDQCDQPEEETTTEETDTGPETTEETDTEPTQTTTPTQTTPTQPTTPTEPGTPGGGGGGSGGVGPGQGGL